MIVRSLILVALAGSAMAAPHQHAPSPYAGHRDRAVAALSDQEVSDLRSGAGMGMALPAELNGYPGPRHVLDLAADLGLTATQRATAERLMSEMRRQAIPLGEQVIAAEAELGRLFSEGAASAGTVAVATDRVARLRGELRSVHLVVHLAMRESLTAEQRAAYDRLRGYAGGHGKH
jgi:Spy/CpxP family protein refolding chaperone